MKKKLPLAFILSLFDKLDPERFQARFLKTLLKVQNVQRGSVWIRRGDNYVCSEAVGPESDKVKGLAISVARPSIVGSVFLKRMLDEVRSPASWNSRASSHHYHLRNRRVRTSISLRLVARLAADNKLQRELLPPFAPPTGISSRELVRAC